MNDDPTARTAPKPSSSEQSPLLPSLRQHTQSSHEVVSYALDEDESSIERVRRFLRWFLASKYGHYFVLGLVFLDITCIFADFLVSLHICEHGADKGFNLKPLLVVQDVLSALSLTTSTIFMVELLASLFAFGLSYLMSPFHLFDATIIVASFVVDVALRGGLEEAGSLIIVLRLWRVVKIIDEGYAGVDNQMEELQEHIRTLEKEKAEVIHDNRTLRTRLEDLQIAR